MVTTTIEQAILQELGSTGEWVGESDEMPWTFGRELVRTSYDVRALLQAWAGDAVVEVLGGSEEDGYSYRYRVEIDDWVFAISVNENMGVESIARVPVWPTPYCFGCETPIPDGEAVNWQCPGCEQPLTGSALEASIRLQQIEKWADGVQQARAAVDDPEQTFTALQSLYDAIDKRFGVRNPPGHELEITNEVGESGAPTFTASCSCGWPEEREGWARLDDAMVDLAGHRSDVVLGLPIT